MPAKIECPDVDNLVERYRAGTSELKLSKEYGVGRPVVARWLREAGVKRRGRSEAELVKWRGIKARGRAAVERQTGAAWVGARGRKVGFAEAVKRAQSHFFGQSRVGKHERALLRNLEDFATVIPQYPVGPYNVDLLVAHPKPIAVEVVSTWPTAKATSPYGERVPYILDVGLSILFVDCTNRIPFNERLVGNEVLAHAELAGGFKAGAGQYWVVRCDGEDPTGLRVQLHKLTGIEAA